MNKEEALKEYAEELKKFLYGESEEDKSREIRLALFSEDYYEEVKNINDKVYEGYFKEVVSPLADKLVDLLSFEGMVKGEQFKKKALELKEELEKKDRRYIIREMALSDFFRTKVGSHYDEDRKLALALRLGALDLES